MTNARKFAEEMESSGTVDAIRREAGNIKYDYFFLMADPETVLMTDCQTAKPNVDRILGNMSAGQEKDQETQR